MDNKEIFRFVGMVVDRIAEEARIVSVGVYPELQTHRSFTLFVLFEVEHKKAEVSQLITFETIAAAANDKEYAVHVGEMFLNKAIEPGMPERKG